MVPNREREFARVPVPELPGYLTQEIVDFIRQYSVSMVLAEEDESQGSPCAGVLCILNGLPGLLTARHVFDRFSRSQTLVLMAGPQQPLRIPAHRSRRTQGSR